ncbi:MAG: hypothetical protein ACJA0U_001661 [Salibacteraceae bacterium]|jgi:hypothetical protein
MKMNRYIVFLAVVIIASSCKPKTIAVPAVLGDVDATSTVAIGGNSFAGYSDDALHPEGQEYSIPSIVLDRMEGSNQFNPFTLPYLSSSSNGINLNGDSKLILGYKTDCNNETSLSPIRKAVSGNLNDLNNWVYGTEGPFYNLSIPNLKLQDLNNVGFGNPANGIGNYNPWFSRIARDQANSSILSDALALDPTFLFLSIGQDDVTDFAKSGATGPALPSSIDFFNDLQEVATTFPNTQGVISIIPNVLLTPYFNTIPYNGLFLEADQAVTINNVFNPIGLFFNVGDNGFLIEDLSEPFGVRKMVEGELVLLSIPLDSVKCSGMGSIVPIPDRYILTLDEITALNQTLFQYNNEISSYAATYNYALADVAATYISLEAGVIYNGVSTSTEFVSGGAFSMDGLNLNPIGNALLANQYIKAINDKYNARIPLAPVTNYPGVYFP